MTAKEFVKTKVPNARVERQYIIYNIVRGRIKGLQEVYYLIRDGRSTMYMGSGKTESNAWVNAKAFIMLKELANEEDK
jgi:hypothetical protein